MGSKFSSLLYQFFTWFMDRIVPRARINVAPTPVPRTNKLPGIKQETKRSSWNSMPTDTDYAYAQPCQNDFDKLDPDPTAHYLSSSSVTSRMHRSSSVPPVDLDRKLYPKMRTVSYSNHEVHMLTNEDDEEELNVVRLNLHSVGVQATTHVILRVRNYGKLKADRDSEEDSDPEQKDSFESRPWISIEYRFNRADDSEHFRVNGPLENVLPGAESYYNIVEPTHDRRLSYFFRYLDYFMNNLEGTIWWNGFIMNLRGDPSTRLQVVDFQMEPTRLMLSVRQLKGLEIVRTPRRLRVIGRVSDKVTRSFTIRGEAAVRLQTTLPKDGTIIIHFPKFFSGM